MSTEKSVSVMRLKTPVSLCFNHNVTIAALGSKLRPSTKLLL
jgi:hypothetical protein